MDRALADPVWLRARLAYVDARQPERAAAWARLALAPANLHLRWAATSTARKLPTSRTRCSPPCVPLTCGTGAGERRRVQSP